MSEGYFPRNGRARGWVLQLIPLAIAVASGIWTLSQMNTTIGNLQDTLGEHKGVAAHGSVRSDLAELRTKAEHLEQKVMGLEKSLSAVNAANDRLSDRLYEMQRSLRNSQGGAR